MVVGKSVLVMLVPITWLAHVLSGLRVWLDTIIRAIVMLEESFTAQLHYCIVVHCWAAYGTSQRAKECVYFVLVIRCLG